MTALVLYESMYGNTRVIAEAIARGLAGDQLVDLVRVGDATPDQVARADLVVVGAPTHIWSMSRPKTRQSAASAAAKPDSGLALEPDATATGVREWLQSLPPGDMRPAAVFDTRRDVPRLLSGRASAAIARRMRRLGYRLIEQPASFGVDKANRLLPGEAARAEAWGARLASLPMPQR